MGALRSRPTMAWFRCAIFRISSKSSKPPTRAPEGGNIPNPWEGETLMGEVAAPPSDSSSYISIPVAEEHRVRSNGNPKPSGFATSDPVNTPLAPDDGPLVLAVQQPFSLAIEHDPPRRRRSRFFRTLLVVASLLLLLAVLIPVALLLRSRHASREEAWRQFKLRAVKHRTAFHFQPDKNWMNDPNGPMYYQGFYHLFYQYNPEGPVWGNIVWGHAVSSDLVHWRHLQPALQPDQWYDARGVWSGSATILPDGTPVLLYTGWSDASEQSQSMAFPANKSDPLLRAWLKTPQNPIAQVPAEYQPNSFRDPTTAWQGEDLVWRLLVGAKTGAGGTVGTALLYKSTDFQTWNFTRSLHSVAGTGMWECPDFFPLPVSGARLGAEFHTSVHGPTVKHVLKISANDKLHDYYSVGTYVTTDDTFVPESLNLDAGIGLRFDYGKFYASKSFFDQLLQRRVLFGWVNESDSLAAKLHKGWASVMSIPRQVWLDNRTTTDVIQYPVEELNSLHGTEVSAVNVTVGAASFVKLDDGGIGGTQLDIEVSFQMPNTSRGLQPPELLDENGQLACTQGNNNGGQGNTVLGPFGVYVLATEDFREQTAVFFHVLQAPGQGLKILVCSDQSRSSLAPHLDKAAFGSFVRVYESDQFLTLRILVDHSVVETFVQGGRTVITSRVYPELALDDAAHVFLFNNGSEPVTASTVKMWNMNSVHITQFS